MKVKNRNTSLCIRTKKEIKEGVEEICVDRQISTTDLIESVLENEIIQHRESKESAKQEKASPSATSAPEKKQ